MNSNISTVDSELASLSTIVIDSNGNPIGQVIYRCALCRKICDSSSDAMSHYQMDHVELSKLQLQHQPVATSSGTTSMNHNARGHSLSNSSAHHHNHQHRINNNRQQFSNSTTPSTSSNSLLKRASNSTSNSLLKRATSSSPSASASNSLLKRASNVMRCYQQTSNTARSANRRSNNPSLASPKLDTIHRQYTTTSASRAAKRYTNTASTSRGGTVSGTSNPVNESTTAISDITTPEQQVTQTDSSLGDGSSTPTSLRNRNATPRHVQRTNQYTANLKAKINAQKSAVNSNTASPQKSTSSSTPNSSQPSEGDSIATTEASPANPATSGAALQKVDIKTYSLRPRSLSRRSVRIS